MAAQPTLPLGDDCGAAAWRAYDAVRTLYRQNPTLERGMLCLKTYALFLDATVPGLPRGEREVMVCTQARALATEGIALEDLANVG